VRHALAPALSRIGADATPGEVLDLKVCDPAVGSGAFLVEACRQLGARLVEAWERWPAQRPTIPADEDDLLHARRLVAQHCLHGVDRNPLALDLAKLSLWLATLASRHEFSFLDHVLRVGDSLVGLPNPKIMAVTWGKEKAQRTFVEDVVSKGLHVAAQMGDLMRREAEVARYAMQRQRFEEAEQAREKAHLIADAVLESFFAGSSVSERDRGLAEMQQYPLSPNEENWAKLAALRERLRASPIGITSFHWGLEFNDVFDRSNPGFDAIIGNPPFAGKNTIASGHPLAYPDWLKTLHPGAHGNADLVAHFFRRAYGLLRRGGAMGLIATNTIRQGDTRETGLCPIVGDGGVIYRAVSRVAWEGEAAVVVAQVFVWKPGEGQPPTPPMLDDRPVRRISAYLVEGDLDGSPATLTQNRSKAFAGTEIFGNGFTFDDVDTKQQAYSLALMRDIQATSVRFQEVVWPYLGGEEATNHPQHSARRYVVDFKDYPLRRIPMAVSWGAADASYRRDCLRRGEVPEDYHGPVASDWPELLRLVETRVKPVREKDNREIYRRIWWRFAERRVELYATIASLDHVLVVNRGASPHLGFARVPIGQVFAKTLAVLALPTHAAFATLQSRVHEIWARFFASTLEDRLRYTPSDCFETFPLPPGYDDAPTLEAAGRAYHDHRAALMIARDQGMTPTYNRFHARTDDAADIVELRRLHHAMDEAVLRAYGWDDLARAAAPQFLDDASEDDHRYQGRLFWPAPFRDALLARLLRLNEERAMAERMS
jgi:hypothetical protein